MVVAYTMGNGQLMIIQWLLVKSVITDNWWRCNMVSLSIFYSVKIIISIEIHIHLTSEFGLENKQKDACLYNTFPLWSLLTIYLRSTVSRHGKSNYIQYRFIDVLPV